jgi:hypothetical protein
MMVEENEEGRSLPETPIWAVATVITLLVSFSFLSHGTLKKLVKVYTLSFLFQISHIHTYISYTLNKN